MRTLTQGTNESCRRRKSGKNNNNKKNMLQEVPLKERKETKMFEDRNHVIVCSSMYL